MLGELGLFSQQKTLAQALQLIKKACRKGGGISPGHLVTGQKVRVLK